MGKWEPRILLAHLPCTHRLYPAILRIRGPWVFLWSGDAPQNALKGQLLSGFPVAFGQSSVGDVADSQIPTHQDPGSF